MKLQQSEVGSILVWNLYSWQQLLEIAGKIKTLSFAVERLFAPSSFRFSG